MSKFGYTMKHMFKSKEAIELEARMEFNKNKRSFLKYNQELDVSVKNFTKMAQEAELSGNHENAKACAKFVLKLQKTQVKVQSILQRFEMMYSMQRLTGVMTNFMKACANMGFNMDRNIDLKSMWKDTAAMDQALSKLDAMSDQMDMVFESIDSGMNLSGEAAPTQAEADADAEAYLNKIMGVYNDVNIPAAPVAAQPAAAQTAAVQQPASAKPAEDETDERLRKLMQELKD